jgi:hypothetical protein
VRIRAADIHFFPIRAGRNEIVEYDLVIFCDIPETCVQGPWCNGNTALCPSRRCGFESRRVHSPDFVEESSYWGDNTEILSPSNLTQHRPTPILKLDRVPYTTLSDRLRDFSGAVALSGRLSRFLALYPPVKKPGDPSTKLRAGDGHSAKILSRPFERGFLSKWLI